MSESESEIREFKSSGIDKSRIIGFSDGVFAFAITLLVTRINLPDGTTESELHKILLGLWPVYFSFILSVLVIGKYWIAHHRILRHIRQFDFRLTWLNIFLLVSIAFLPFPTDVFGTFDSSEIAVVFYAGSLAMVGLWQLVIWWYVVSKGIIDRENTTKYDIQEIYLKSLVPPLIFIVSIPIAFFNIYIAEASWILAFFINDLIGKRYEKR